MPSKVSNKIVNIFNQLKNVPYNGTIRCRHFCVAIRNGKVISPVLCNYFRTYVFGKKRGTMHAEMHCLKYLLCTDRSFEGFFNHKSLFLEKQCILRGKGVR